MPYTYAFLTNSTNSCVTVLASGISKHMVSQKLDEY